MVAPTTPGPGPRRPLPPPRTGAAITAVAVLGRVLWIMCASTALLAASLSGSLWGTTRGLRARSIGAVVGLLPHGWPGEHCPRHYEQDHPDHDGPRTVDRRDDSGGAREERDAALKPCARKHNVIFARLRRVGESLGRGPSCRDVLKRLKTRRWVPDRRTHSRLSQVSLAELIMESCHTSAAATRSTCAGRNWAYMRPGGGR